MKGKEPTRRVIIKLMSKGENAASSPSMIETIRDRSINNALTRRALPILIDIAFTFIAEGLDPFLEFYILFDQFRNSGIDVCELVITVKFVDVAA